MPEDSIKSPCTGVCTVADSGLCMGCFRTMEEITAWLAFTETEKRHIIERLADRREAMFA